LGAARPRPFFCLPKVSLASFRSANTTGFVMLIAIMAVEAETGSNARQVFGEELKSGLALLLFCDGKQD